MPQTAPMPLRNCPLCGIVMQAGKSADHLPHPDRFECLTCGTLIEVPYRPAESDERR